MKLYISQPLCLLIELKLSKFLLELKRSEGTLGEAATLERLDVWWADQKK